MLVYENRTSKMNFFGVKEFFRMNFDFKNGCKMNLKITTKNHEADPEKGFLTKSISKPYGRATVMPPAWELIILLRTLYMLILFPWYVRVLVYWWNKRLKICSYSQKLKAAEELGFRFWLKYFLQQKTTRFWVTLGPQKRGRISYHCFQTFPKQSQCYEFSSKFSRITFFTFKTQNSRFLSIENLVPYE